MENEEIKGKKSDNSSVQIASKKSNLLLFFAPNFLIVWQLWLIVDNNVRMIP
jgi:hypothetical protein